MAIYIDVQVLDVGGDNPKKLTRLRQLGLHKARVDIAIEYQAMHDRSVAFAHLQRGN